MGTTWHLKELREHIRHRGSEHAYLLNTVNSIARMDEIFGFHMQHARDGFKGFLGDASGTDVLARAFGLASGDFTNDEENALAVEAHFIGALQTARAIYDMFSHVVNGLILEVPFQRDECDIAKVADRLPACQLRNVLQDVRASHTFKYLSDIINTIKHHGLVPIKFFIDFQADQSGLQVSAFEYKKRTYSATWGYDLLKNVLDVKNQHIACGVALNAHLFDPQTK